MQQNNLFSYCPKELVTDGFLAWLFDFLNYQGSDDSRLSFFNQLFSNNETLFQDVSNIQTERQNAGVDLLVHFISKGVSHTVLFENKTWSGPHSNQFLRYKDLFPNCHKYIYLKLAFIPYCEQAEAKKYDYVVITSSQLLDAINPLKGKHPFIKEYCEYLTNQFVTPLQQLEAELFELNNFKKLGDSQAQQFVLSELEEKLTHHKIPHLYFKVGSSFGRPWTQLDIANREAIFGEENEYIFWRIDIRSGRYYIRLNQWADIGEDFRQQKISRLELLRNKCKDITDYYKWKAGILSERGLKESEIAIFFLDENSLSRIRNDLESFSLDFIKAYLKI